uniref:NECAP PHear domain-containing protein n=2 Tax=Plectus sambesii TaxID=2011161 RepID=A0A914WA63_9BILA
MTEDYESVSLVKPEVFVYRIPPLGNNRGHKAADWKLDAPDWSGRMRLVALGKKLELRLEDKTTGDLFAKCPIEEYPSLAVEPVSDSSRYFVVRLMDDNGRSAFIGLGFADRGDSFDLNVSLQDHFKYIEKSADMEKREAEEASKPKLDLGFKEGQTITINLGKKSGGTQRPRPTGGAAGGPVPFLPPPPSGPSSSPRTQQRSNAPSAATAAGSNPFAVGPPTTGAATPGGFQDLGGLFSNQPPSKPAGGAGSLL